MQSSHRLKGALAARAKSCQAPGKITRARALLSQGTAFPQLLQSMLPSTCVFLWIASFRGLALTWLRAVEEAMLFFF